MNDETKRALDMLNDARDVYHEAASAPDSDRRGDRLIRADELFMEARTLVSGARAAIANRQIDLTTERIGSDRIIVSTTARGSVLVTEHGENGAPTDARAYDPATAISIARDMLKCARMALAARDMSPGADEEG